MRNISRNLLIFLILVVSVFIFNPLNQTALAEVTMDNVDTYKVEIRNVQKVPDSLSSTSSKVKKIRCDVLKNSDSTDSQQLGTGIINCPPPTQLCCEGATSPPRCLCCEIIIPEVSTGF